MNKNDYRGWLEHVTKYPPDVVLDVLASLDKEADLDLAAQAREAYDGLCDNARDKEAGRGEYDRERAQEANILLTEQGW